MNASTHTMTVNYQWDFHQGNCSTTSWYSSSPLPVSSNAGDYNVCLTITNNSTCNSMICHTVTIVNGFHPPCDASFSTWKDSSASHPVFFGGNSACNAKKYLWDFGDGNHDTTFGTSSTSHVYAVNATYSVCVKSITMAGDTCTFCDTVNSAPICPPTVTFVLNKDSIQTSTWDIYPTYSSNVNKAKWNWGDGTASTGLYPTHTYTTAGWYNVCLTAYSSCGDSVTVCQNDSVYRQSSNTSMVTVNVINVNGSSTGIVQTKSINNNISVYPNPTSDQFYIGTNSTEKVTVDLYDINGRHLFSRNVSDKSNINIATLDNGAYTLTIKTADHVINKKLVILR